MILYEWKIEDGYICGCSCCGSNVPLSLFKRNHGEKMRDLCEVCASTLVGSNDWHKHPSNCHHVETQKIIAAVANIILERLGKFGEKPEGEDG